MPHMEFDVAFPFPVEGIGLTLGLRDEPIELREYAVVVRPRGTDGQDIPKGLLNWGFSAPLGGCYQYVPSAVPGRAVCIDLPLRTEVPVGSLHVTVLSWKPVVPGTDPHEVFDRLVLTYSAAGTGDAPSPARFSTVRRSTRG